MSSEKRTDGPRAQRPTAWRWLLTCALLCGVAREADAQRVQVPTGGYDPAASSAGGYALPPPEFNPYTSAGGSAYSAPLGPPPANVPYSYSPPVAAQPQYGAPAAPGWGAPLAPAYDPNAPTPGAGLYGEGSPLGWQPGTYGFEQNDGSVTRFRKFLARLRGEHTLLLGDNSADAFEVNRLELASTFALPIAGSLEQPLLVTPGFAFNWFGGPEGDPAGMPRGPDLPPRVYDAYLDFSWFPRWTPELGAEFGFRTGVWTDFDEFNGDTMRFLGRGLGVVSITPQFELLLGAVYLDRVRVKTLPAGGVRWRPSPDWDLYLVFPNPKIRRTMFSTSSAEWWWYVAGEYGGGSWTVDRVGTGDRIDYNDIRVVLGLEWQTPRQASGHIEIGYAVDREILFADTGDPAKFSVDDAVMFRAGIGF